MSKKNRYYSDIKIIKGKKSRFFKLICVLLFCFVFIMFSYSISLILGKTLNVSGGLFNKNSVLKYYGISFGHYLTEEEAIGCAKEVVSLGAGGYILNRENGFEVIGAIYLSKNDAQLVINNNNSAEKLKVVELEVNKQKYSYDDEDFDKLIKVVNGLYANIVAFDNGSLNYIGLASKVNELDGECCVILNNNNGNEFYSKVILIEKILNNLTNTTLINENVGSCVKYSLIQIIDLLA